ncbi:MULTISPECIES: cysteine--tRNA ligase [Nitrosomonas]|uniref:Cysteine--tRNA ligase n=1 Tax=Nitrosomonas communis TaxID=44574 RepID=A0A0F7KEM8_9PROT|nr:MULTISPECIES: cysteine--tRNA ligase [Nitrosomonas]AKH38910.1 cysteinyl-tRNA synthetase [Nitrosomonas communis]TYP91866.1 cysteinyl-tRNA synthetase [Nitrosomonas communis]UVS61048.1 cysteine--tRNA ligase [Nitrosomonas sp. PLL12]
MLKIYNTLTRKKEKFVPIKPGEVRMYVCGMTVYDYCHLGHARVLVVFDTVVRWLEVMGFKVTYVRNITDIDDKIIKRAQENGETINTLTQRYIDAMYEDAARLGVAQPTYEPRATQCIEDMIGMILTLIQKGLAYVAANGDVFYSVHQFPHYGKLSGKSLEDLRAGERVDIDFNKKDPLDFVLWKAAKAGEPCWDSPWGKGRPGWHIECSAMSEHYLGEHFDIHGGGQDLQFPHHENEIAQSEGAHDHAYVNYWMHNGFVRVDNEKMSKSLGNFFTVREVLARYQPEVVRFFILRAHYRSPLNYSDEHLNDARNALDRLYIALKEYSLPSTEINWDESYAERFKAAMNDDFNTAEAIAVLFDLAGEINRTNNAQLAVLLKALGGTLGLLQQNPQAYLQNLHSAEKNLFSQEAIEQMIQQRLDARKNRDFVQADNIRKQLAAAGIILEDSVQGTTWRRQ